MFHWTKRIISLMLTVLLVLSVVIGTLPTAASAKSGTGYSTSSDVVYKKDGKYIANWGYRGETCTFLSPNANQFYTSQYSFDTLSKLEGGSGQSDASKSQLYTALQQLMDSHHTHETSYGETRNLYKYTDCQLSDYSTISSFYSGTSLKGQWGTGWNREHTWPNSKGMNGNDENDIMMLRPTATSENSSRGNTAYGQSSGYYDPNCENPPASLRGDVARIMLYVYVRWGNTGKMWGKSGVMESLDVLLQWMEEDPVDTWEMGRNDAVQSITGTRNVFVDFPEYAWLLFGQSVPANMTTPSGNAGASSTPGGNDQNGSTDCNHTWDEGKVIRSASCTTAGLKLYTCTCGETKEEQIPPMGSHSYGKWTVTAQATTDRQGEETRSCVICGHKESRPIEKLPSQGPDATIVVIGVCVAVAGGTALLFVLKKKKH